MKTRYENRRRLECQKQRIRLRNRWQRQQSVRVCLRQGIFRAAKEVHAAAEGLHEAVTRVYETTKLDFCVRSTIATARRVNFDELKDKQC